MYIWNAASVEETPVVRLSRWSVREVQPRATRHLLGHNLTEREGRVSSTITEYDAERHRVTTESGRVYELVGPPGQDSDAEGVWRSWLRCVGLEEASSWSDVTHEYTAP